MIIDYDSEADVLYIIFKEKAGPSEYSENAYGVVVRVSRTTGEVVGLTIPQFSRRAEVGEIRIDEIGNIAATARLEELLA